MRTELCEWLEAQYGFLVDGVATPLDAIYARGIGAYYRDCIQPIERAVIAAEEAGRVEGGQLDMDAVIELGSGEETTVGEVLRREDGMYDQHAQHSRAPPDKAALASYCLRILGQQPPYENDVVFFDDRREYIEQVERACAGVGVACYAVHVDTAKMRDAASYDAALRRSGLRRGAWSARAGQSTKCVLS